jgi:hypothetical protein
LFYLRSSVAFCAAFVVILHTLLFCWRNQVANFGCLRISVHILVIAPHAWWPILSLSWHISIIPGALFIRCSKGILRCVSISHFPMRLGVTILTEFFHLLLLLH